LESEYLIMKLLKHLSFTRSAAILLVALLMLTLMGGANAQESAPAPTPIEEPVTLRIGYQKGDYLTVLKARGTLEARFGPNVTVEWLVFPAGPQLLEALNTGAIDIGSTGETPPIFAQAAGTPLVYVATQSGSGAGQAIIVPENSPIKTLADLEGKTIAFNKASSAHLFLVLALESAGLQYSDVNPAFLAPADARAAFQGGSVDAWVIWNPYLAAAQQEINAQILLDGADLAETKSYYEASRTFVDTQPDLLRGIVDELRLVADWIGENKTEAAQILADETGIELSVWEQALSVDQRDVRFIDEETIEYQQKVADIFFNLELIPEQLVISEVVWQPEDLDEILAQEAAEAELTDAATAEAEVTS
jgi:sulfonate transport system substrate-binding protein